MTPAIKCIITDDEPMARKGLQGYIEKIDFLELAGVCEDAIQLNSLLKQQPADLLFLDIEMPYVTGIDFLKNTPNSPKVIFTTAYEQYAIKGYELDVLDYLLKPISFERFLKAANKAYDYFSSAVSNSGNYLFIKTDNKLEKVNLQELLFVEAMENYVALYTADKKLITHSTLKALQEKLPAGQFIQPHKSYVVNIQCIQSIEGNILHVGGKYQIPISKYQKEEIMERIVNDKLLKK
ncbi:DNA-binding response regulator [Niastella koreensis]|uniref:Two component transcriptional regulator, LytTR family n=2 Tax=Niastella koreensis TaxID=354356 RepID=G8T6V4_NIAKG|nr:LytTR family DNA-binding domain-containing protein [Niastella koreensis]AEV97957.1 two component transcriptional regulator, LytTR family [Niastella koreensis GR20-10]OQP40241.1 DNA-binding response regulator [Niastella koreensis]